MDPNRPSPEGTLNLEKSITLLETPFSEACRALGLEPDEPKNVVEVADSVFMFDPEQGHVFSGAVILDNRHGFFGIEIGANWLQTAENLESQGFIQAEDPNRFTRPGRHFGTSVYMYPDSDSGESRVQHYSLCARYGSDP